MYPTVAVVLSVPPVGSETDIGRWLTACYYCLQAQAGVYQSLVSGGWKVRVFGHVGYFQHPEVQSPDAALERLSAIGVGTNQVNIGTHWEWWGGGEFKSPSTVVSKTKRVPA
jgi:hypothetical protein